MITPQKPKHQESPIRRYNFLKETSPAPLPQKAQLDKKQNERNSYKTLERQKNKKAIEDI